MTDTCRPAYCAMLAVPLLLLLGAAPSRAQAGLPGLDVLLVGGRVLDPESGLDGIRNIGIRGTRIVAVTTGRPAARQTIDVRDLVVSPGFIDLHSHGQDSTAYRLYARDGVTTALELELGTYPVAPWYAAREGKALVNFGVSVGHPGARRAFLDSDSSVAGVEVLFSRDGPWARSGITSRDFAGLGDRLEAGLREGALGIGMGLQYTPGASREEVLDVFTLAARRHVPVFVHMRYQGLLDPGGGVNALQELLLSAALSGAGLHVVHVTSMGLSNAGFMLRMIRQARARGLDVTTEAYPYTAAATAIQSALFDPGWQQRIGITYGDVLWPATGERLTEASFNRYRRQGGSAVYFAIPDSIVDLAYRDSIVMVASDAMPGVHPRAAGAHARVLATYVRERHVLSLMEAIRKMTLLPAQRLERLAPQMQRKGRVKVGADADLTIFDPGRVQDRATFEQPSLFSEGITHVLVGGTFVVRDGQPVAGVAPGRPIRGPRQGT